jgi:bacillopeptidase F
MKSRRYSTRLKKEKRKLVYTLLAIIGLMLFLVVFGIKIFSFFSILVDRMKGEEKVTTQPTVLSPPILEPLPEATNSGTLQLQGTAKAGSIVIIYNNNQEVYKDTIKSDSFIIPIKAFKGENVISSKQVDTTGVMSELSNVVTSVIETEGPKLSIEYPENNSTITSSSNIIEVKGSTDESADITINGRIPIVGPNGSFKVELTLQEGNNDIEIIAHDIAGNETKQKLSVTWKKSE